MNDSFMSPTEWQLKLISEMQEFSEYPLPKFKGTTKREATIYITKYLPLSKESTWAIEHGYE